MFFSKKLKKFKNIKHCFFSRKNGFSKGHYSSLNCGSGSGDEKRNVLKNLNLVSKKIGCKDEVLITLNQIHSNKVVYFENESSIRNKLPGDAIVTKVKNVAIGILAADCAPILLYDHSKKITTQNEFLKKMGILERANILSRKMTFKEKANMFYRLKRLLDYKEMGILFKVLFAQKRGRKFSLGF